MNPPSEDVKDMLEHSSSGLGLVFASDLFIDEMPETPDAVVTVRDTGGFDSEANYTYERPTIQVRVRGTKNGYQAMYALAHAIQSFLHAKANETWNGTRYVGILKMGDILSLGRDDSQRPLCRVDFRIHRTA